MTVTYQLYGHTLATDFPLRALDPVASDHPVDVTFHLAPEPFWDERAWSEAKPIQLGKGRQVGVTVWQRGTQFCMREPEIVDFYFDGATIYAFLHNPAFDYIVELRLLGPVLAFWLECQGFPNLHAAAAILDGQALIFLATNGGGKSSLVAGLMEAGATFLSDDIVPLRFDDAGKLWAEPGYPRMRFWPDAAHHFLGGVEPFSLVHPEYEKRWVPIRSRWPNVATQAAPVGAIYLPRRDRQMADSILDPLPRREAVIQLLAHSFSARRLPLPLQAQRLSFYNDVAASVPVYTLTYPDGYDHLPMVVAALGAALVQK